MTTPVVPVDLLSAEEMELAESGSIGFGRQEFVDRYFAIYDEPSMRYRFSQVGAQLYHYVAHLFSLEQELAQASDLHRLMHFHISVSGAAMTRYREQRQQALSTGSLPMQLRAAARAMQAGDLDAAVRAAVNARDCLAVGPNIAPLR